MYEQIGGQAGCRRIAEAFYSHLAEEPVLVAVYPRHVRCATEAIGWFLEELTGGPSEHANHTMYSSLAESHRRFRIGPGERDAWLRNMERAFGDCDVTEPIRQDLMAYFRSAMEVIVNSHDAPEAHTDLAGSDSAKLSWTVTKTFELIAEAVREGDIAQAIRLIDSPAATGYLAARPSAHARVLALLCSTDDNRAVAYIETVLDRSPALIDVPFSRGRTMLHQAAMNGAPKFAASLVRRGARADIPDTAGHCALYALANNAAGTADMVALLISAGADVNAAGGVQLCTPLHMAARRGNVAMAKALLAAGANPDAMDTNGVTPLGRAVNCRKREAADLLAIYRSQM